MQNPGLLYFLPLALVPIILHLITLLRLRTVELSTFAFLMDTRQQQRKHLLLELLLMLLRGLFVASIVVALARPVARQAGLLAGSGSERDVTVILDAGPTMALRSGASSSLERGKAIARKVVGFLDARDHLTLVRASHEPDSLLRGYVGAYPGVDRTIDRINLSAASANLTTAMESVLEMEAKGKRTIYLITDGNAASWPALKEYRRHRLLDEKNRLVVLNVGSQEPVHNSAIIGATPESMEAVAGLPTVLHATILNSSADKQLDTVLSISLEGEQVQRSHLELSPGQRRTVPVTVTPSKSGILRGQFEITGDAFPLDDTFLFSVNVGGPVRVLVLAPPAPTAVQTDPAVFIKAALDAPSKLLSRQVTRESNQKGATAGSIEATLIRLPKLDIAMLRERDVIILADVPLEDELASGLRQVISEGTGLVLFSGKRMDPERYQELLLNHSLDSTVKFAARPNAERGTQKSQVVSAVDLAHPILKAFEDGGQEYFVTTQLYWHTPLRVPEARTPTGNSADDDANRLQAKSLLMLSDGQSVLAEGRLGKGKVLVSGVGLGLDLSDLAIRPEFVPLLLRAVAHVRSPSPVQLIPPVSAAQPAIVRITDKWPHARAEGTDPANRKHPIKLHRSGHTFSGAMTSTSQKGYYELMTSPRDKSAPQTIKHGFAVNLAPGPSAFSSIKEQEIRDRLSPSELTILNGPLEDEALIAQLTGRKELWRSLIWLMFAIFGVEFLLATFRQSLQKSEETSSLWQKPWLRRLLAPWRMSAYAAKGVRE